ncbi:MAG: tRNA (N6-isopentenyl adenosine(37)-C2)-methylthiotransferase MiaB, partial [Candidatus Omnitrophica bacterium]|nr:tRNA (N6-isopentenyl adenosine(37)-C2)-methylthiotransferase MiaB [Candidatus Omnitrophota bacterium]
FGCQMNFRDSEEIAGLFIRKGWSLASAPEEADVAIFNTCSVRKHAEDRAISNIGELKALKKKRPGLVIGVVGCMAKAQGEKIIERLPIVDFITGPANIYDIPGAVESVLANRKEAVIATDKEARPRIENIAYHTKGISALVTIMEGCNNYCSYCIVPYVRGREVSRPADDIIDEIKALADGGYKEVTLLGQNVNSYRGHPGSNTAGRPPFAELLERIDGIEGIERIRFLTSHPKDAGDGLFRAMRDLPKVCEHLHLPLQSGSDRMLKSMNRGYTASDYLKKVGMLRKHVPDCAITTDIIVGYPGESDEDFKMTKKLVEDIGFNSAFIFKYSPRPPAKASGLEDDVLMKVKEERNQALLKLRDKISDSKDREFIGKPTEVLVESICRKEKHKVTGRNRQNIKAVFEGGRELIGMIKKVRVDSVVGHTLAGSALMLMVFLAATAATAPVSAETVEEYFVSGDYENTVREGVKQVGSSREQDKLYYMIGTSLNKIGRYDLARKNYNQIIGSFPRSRFSPLAQLGIADSYYLAGDYKNALAEYEKYITKYPKSEGGATAYFRLAKSAQKEGKWQAARNYYQKVRGEYPMSFEAQMAAQALGEEILFFTVQVGSFNKKSNALKLCDELVKKGYPASIVKSGQQAEESYRVRVGKLDAREAAEELAKKLRAEGLPTKVLP